MTISTIRVRAAKPSDVPQIQAMREPFIGRRILLAREPVELYESVQEMLVAVDETDRVVGCGALHVMWKDLAEVRSVVVDQNSRGQGVGQLIVAALIERAMDLGIRRVFCLTFEVDFFAKLGFEPIADAPIDPETFAELVRSSDEGIAEFLDLARVKQNTLGNTRMLRLL